MKAKSARKPCQRKAPEKAKAEKSGARSRAKPSPKKALAVAQASKADAAFASAETAVDEASSALLPVVASPVASGLREPESLFDYSSEPQGLREPARGPLSSAENRDRLRLIRTPHIGAVTFWQLIAHFGSAAAAIEALPQFAKHGSRVSPKSVPSIAAVEAEMERATAAGMTLVATGEAGYPPLLTEIEAPPPLLYIKGDPRIWERPAFGIVGSRNASGAGLKFTTEISAELSRLGLLVVSGLARGIDGAAHRGAVPYGTCAVLPGGLDRIYPPEHASLAADIVQNGLLVAECPPGFVARAQDFPRRNRIISGASLGVLVVEAAERSGSLITARLAGEQNREVFAAPGHPLDAGAAGTNRLIKEGAVLTTSTDDIIAALKDRLRAWAKPIADAPSPPTATKRTPPRDVQPVPREVTPRVSGDGFAFLDETITDVLKLLSFSPITVDDLCRMTGREPQDVQAAVMSLDLAGRLERRGASHIVLRA